MQILHEFLRLGVDYSTTSLLQRRSSSPPPPPTGFRRKHLTLLGGELWRAVFQNVGWIQGLWPCCQVPLFCHVPSMLFHCLGSIYRKGSPPQWPQWAWLQFTGFQQSLSAKGRNHLSPLGLMLTLDTALIRGTERI